MTCGWGYQREESLFLNLHVLRSSRTCSTSLNYCTRRPLQLQNSFLAIKVIMMRTSRTSTVSIMIKHSISVTTDTPRLKQQSHCRQWGASWNSVHVRSTMYAHTRPTSWNPNSSTTESNLLQHDQSVTRWSAWPICHLLVSMTKLSPAGQHDHCHLLVSMTNLSPAALTSSIILPIHLTTLSFRHRKKFSACLKNVI